MKSALFLGAGASVFAGHPTTKQLLDRVWARIDRDDTFRRGLARRIAEDRQYADVEEFYDGIRQMRGICGVSRAWPPFSEPPDAAPGEMARLMSAIRDEMLESFSLDKNYHRLVRPMFDMVRSVMRGAGPDELLVFTTNYDLVMENYALIAGLKLVDGFERYQYMTRRWNGLWPDTGNRIPLNLIKLHGSMNWCRDDDGNMLDSRGTTNRDADHDLLIAPTEGAKNYSGEPFSTLLRRFREGLEGVDVLLAIGSSYRDRNVVEAIRARLGAGMVLISVSPTAPHDIRRVSGAEPKAVETGGVTLKIVGPNIILCEMKFGPATYDMVRNALEAAYGLVERIHNGFRIKVKPASACRGHSQQSQLPLGPSAGIP